MSKKATTPTTTRKNTPKVTNVQKRMTPEQQEAWFNEHCAKLDAETQKTIRAKLTAPLTIRNAAKKGMEYNQEWVSTLTLMQALSIKTLVDANIKTRETEKEAARAALKEQMAVLEAQAKEQMAVLEAQTVALS